MISVGPLTPADHDAWEALFRAYICFDERTLTAETYDRSWAAFQKDTRTHGLEWARKCGCGRLYWSTHEDNATARRLYDRVAENRGFIRYEIDL